MTNEQTKPNTNTDQKLDKTARADVLSDDVRIDTGVETDKVRTFGWQLFDTIVHGFINGVLNIAASIVMAKDRANYNINKAIDGKDNIFGDELDLSNTKRRKTYLTNLFGLNFYEFSDWLDAQFYNKDSDGNIRGAEHAAKNEFSGKQTGLQKKGGIFGWLEGTTVGKIPGIKQMLKPLGKYTGGILFLAWGGHITNSMMWIMESPKIKPKLVKALDRLADKFRRSKPDEAELKEREAIYRKLDTDLAGKSVKGIWGARFAGIASVIGVAALAEAVDAGITGRYNADGSEKKQLGILRVSQGVFAGARKGQKWYNNRPGTTKKWEPAALSTDKTSVQAATSSYMLDQSVTEVMGTGITTTVQYLYLMMREFFGVGPKTNLGDAKKNQEGNEPSKETTPAAEQKTKEREDRAKVDIEVDAEKMVGDRAASREEMKDHKRVSAKDIIARTEAENGNYTGKTRKHDREELKGRKHDSHEDAVRTGAFSRKDDLVEAVV